MNNKDIEMEVIFFMDLSDYITCPKCGQSVKHRHCSDNGDRCIKCGQKLKLEWVIS